MNRSFIRILPSVVVVTVAVLVSRPELVNASWPELRQVSDPDRAHGLSLGFAEVSGAFLSDVTLVIEDHSGTEVVNTVVEGPWFFMPLPAGTYNIKAIFDDQVKHMNDIRLSEKLVTMMVVYWDLNLPATQMMASSPHVARSTS
jgi:hypothetical protein